MNLLSNWFRNNLDFVLFICGLAFIVTATSIFIQPRKGTQFKLSGILWLLAVFCLIHGISEWLDMREIVKGKNFIFDGIRVATVFISYCFLFEFGRQLNYISIPASLLPKWKRVFKYADWVMIFFIILVMYILSFIHFDFWETGTTLVRYLLALPGGVLTGLGLILYYKKEKDILKKANVRGYFILGGGSFIVYGFLAGLVVPKNNLLFATWLNNDSFLSTVKIPVQVFRAMCAISGAFSLIGVLKIFNWETTEKLYDEIEQRKDAEEKIISSRGFIETLFNAMKEGFCVIDPKDWKILKVNKAFLEGLFLEEKDVIGKRCYEVTHNRLDPCGPPHDICPLTETIKTGAHATAEHIHYDKEGRKRYVDVSTSPILNEKGEVYQIVHISRDITERKEAEEELRRAHKQLKEAQVQLVQTAKMAALGQLAGGVAHEINNPLTGVLNNVQLIKLLMQDKKEMSPEEFKELLDIIEESALRCKKITTSLLDFSHASMNAFITISVNETIEKVFDLIEQELKLKNIWIKKELELNLPQVRGDSQLLQQVFFNLISNASWAIDKKGGGEITIKTKYDPESHRVCISISDTGIGIPKDKMGKLFEPFFTTKGVGEGTGLGLSVAYNIIKRHKGTIEVESRENEGTTAKIYLPCV